MRTNLIKLPPEEKVKESVEVVNKETESKVSTSNEGKLDLIIAFDTTGSMSSYISSVKKQVISIISDMLNANPKLMIGIVAFGDYADMISPEEFGSAYQCLGLTNDRDKLVDFIKLARSTGGGDSDEFYELVIRKIVSETKWRDGVTKSVLLIADARPHSIDYVHPNCIHKIDWVEEAQIALDEGVIFDTVNINSLSSSWLKELSRITEGVNVPFKDANNTGNLLRATSYARGGDSTLMMFKELIKDAEKENNEELKAVYSVYSKEIIK